MLAYNESAHAFFKWDPAKGEYPNLVLFAIWDQRSQDQSASDEYGRFIVPPGANDAHVIKADTLRGLRPVSPSASPVMPTASAVSASRRTLPQRW